MMPDLDFLAEIPRQYYVFLFALCMVCGYVLDWTLDRWGFGIFLNVGVLFVGAFAALVAADQAGFYFWKDALPVFVTGIGGGAAVFLVLATAKNKILP
ncbi:MAG: hypothetical protein KDJ55_02220 [Rhodobiaceae bacterium]|nr:hypothetical protein [Rhodobiaceae bacterium]MCC0019313.1 hypothetical protein [Rhodobiaceae bacterium]MCC0062264.1 hypothetical protein [Rhodobiaceae bacterium]